MVGKVEVIDCISAVKPKALRNEDCYFFTESSAVVLDGATGLSDYSFSSESDGNWFVNQFKFHAQKLKRGKSTIENIESILINIIDDVPNKTYLKSIAKHELPSAGMIWAEFLGTSVKFHRLGDCRALLKKGEHIQEVFNPSPLEKLDAISKNKIREAIERGLSSQEARQEILPVLRSNRSKMNQANGYGALSLSLECLKYIETVTFDVDPGDKILLMTDGFYAQVDTYKMMTYEKLFSEVEQRNSGKLINKMRELEHKDINLQSYTRLKPSDDATCVLLQINNPSE